MKNPQKAMTSAAMLLASFVSLTALGANTCTWVGTSGNWSVAENWKDGVKPTSDNGDTVVLTCESAGAAITNDMGEVKIAKLTLETPNAVTLRGDAIRVTSQILTHQAAVVDNNIFIDGNVKLNCGEKTYGGTYRPTFNGDFAIASGKNLYIFGNSGANFYGTINGPSATIYFGDSSARWDSGDYHFYGAVVVKTFSQNDYGTSNANFYNTGNQWEKIVHRYSPYFHFRTANSFPLSVADFASSGERRSPYRGYYLYEDQTIDRITCSGTCPVVKYGSYDKRQYNWFRNNATKTITLTLKATADAKTSCSIRMNTSDINFVYDPVGDYTQEFLESTLNSRTSITVKGGTLKFTGDTLAESYKTLDIREGATFCLDVTNTAALKSVTTLKLGKNARFIVGASAKAPFSSKPTVTLAEGAKFVIAEGAAIEIGTCTSPDGLVQPLGAYTGSGTTGAKVSWVEGAGTLNVAATTTDYVFWKSAVDGMWSEGSKWMIDDTPAAGNAVAIARDTDSYMVTVEEAPAAPTGLLVMNGGADKISTLKVAAPMTVNTTASKPLNVATGGRIEVVKDGVLTLTADKSYTDPTMKIQNGGALELNGGKMTFGYLASPFSISGTETAEGLFKVSSGTCTVSSVASVGRFCLNKNGRFAMTNGVFISGAYTSYYRTFEFAGGAFDLSGDAQFWTSIARTPYQGYGTINFSGNAVFCQHRTSSVAWQSRVYFEPPSSTNVLAINVTEHAKYDCDGIIETDLGGPNSGTVTMRLASDQKNHFGAYAVIGTGNSRAILTLEDGILASGGYGTVIGGSGDGERYSAPVHSEGRLIQTGGTLFIYADQATLPTSGPVNGFLVGYMPVYSTGALVGSTTKGTYELSGGTVTNVYGYTHVGFGAAKGRVVQTGGFFGTSNNKPVAIGAYSGEGEWIVSNGTAQVRGQVYLGGVVSNDFSRLCTMLGPEGLTGSKGRLEVSGGTFTCYNLLAGTERGLGSAEVEVGLAGTLNVWGVEFNNAKVVRKIGDAGTGTFTSSGDLTITDKATLEVDASALTDQTSGAFTLLTYAGTRTGDFGTVTLKGFADPNEWNVRWSGKKLVCKRRSGTIYFVK